MPGRPPRRKARQVGSIGESPAEARAKQESSGTIVPTEGALTVPAPPRGEEVTGPLTNAQLAAIEESEGGFKDNGVRDGVVQDVEETAEAPSPEKAVEMIRQISQDKLQLTTERDVALHIIERYRNLYGDLD